jgi:Ca2+-dependent lipid-binding protein
MLHLEPEREDTFQSNVVRCTYDPVFNQTFQFQGLSVDNIRLQTLVFRFYNHALNNRAIGKASLQLRDVDLFGVVVQMKILGSEEMEVRDNPPDNSTLHVACVITISHIMIIHEFVKVHV